MTVEEARAALAAHVLPSGNDGKPSFLGMLRPYRGLSEESFHDVMRCIVALAPELAAEHVDRSIASALWGLCYHARLWGLEESGMLRRNGLIAAADVARLAEWIDCIAWATMQLLDTSDLDVALEPYRRLNR